MPDDLDRILAALAALPEDRARGLAGAAAHERGAIEAAERRDRLIEAEAKRLAGSDAPVIAAGSTGSMPATAKLLATIATLPHGARGAARPRHRSRRRLLGADRRQRRRQDAMTARPPPATRNSPCTRCSTSIGITRGDVEQLGAGAAWPRSAGVGSPAPGRHHRALAAARQNQDFDAAADAGARIAVA